MRHALELYKARFPGVEAIVIGTRRSDPHGGECAIWSRFGCDLGWVNAGSRGECELRMVGRRFGVPRGCTAEASVTRGVWTVECRRSSR